MAKKQPEEVDDKSLPDIVDTAVGPGADEDHVLVSDEEEDARKGNKRNIFLDLELITTRTNF